MGHFLLVSWIFDPFFVKIEDFRINDDKRVKIFDLYAQSCALCYLFYSSCMAAAKERKENFLSLYISFFERNMHNNKLLCLYRTYLRYVLTKIEDLYQVKRQFNKLSIKREKITWFSKKCVNISQQR